jgi:hypothetical protein
MPTIHNIAQNTPAWLKLRAGKVTASEMHHLLTPTFAKTTGTKPRKYLCTKLAEAWFGEPLPGFGGSWATDQGHLREEEAIPWFALTYDCEPKRVGFVTGDDGRCGCSPDALLGDDGGLEVKCPQPTAHVGYVLDGEVPDEYATQVHGSLYVTGRASWTFLSYRADFPPLVVTVKRDEAIMRKIGAALASFYQEFDAAMATLKQRDK